MVTMSGEDAVALSGDSPLPGEAVSPFASVTGAPKQAAFGFG
jgi:hypothetical protein